MTVEWVRKDMDLEPEEMADLSDPGSTGALEELLTIELRNGCYTFCKLSLVTSCFL